MDLLMIHESWEEQEWHCLAPSPPCLGEETDGKVGNQEEESASDSREEHLINTDGGGEEFVGS